MIQLENVTDDQFRVVMETTSRMGICKKEGKLFYQSCYITKLDNKFFLVNYKEILGKEMTGKDHAKTNTVAILLEKWGIVKIANKEDIDKYGTIPTLFVIPFKCKSEYTVSGKVPSYKISKFIADFKENIKKDEVTTK